MHFRRYTRAAVGARERKYQDFYLYVFFVFLLRKLDSHMQKKETGPLSYTKINSKYIKDPNVG